MINMLQYCCLLGWGLRKMWLITIEIKYCFTVNLNCCFVVTLFQS